MTYETRPYGRAPFQEDPNTRLSRVEASLRITGRAATTDRVASAVLAERIERFSQRVQEEGPAVAALTLGAQRLDGQSTAIAQDLRTTEQALTVIAQYAASVLLQGMAKKTAQTPPGQQAAQTPPAQPAAPNTQTPPGQQAAPNVQAPPVQPAAPAQPATPVKCSTGEILANATRYCAKQFWGVEIPEPPVFTTA